MTIENALEIEALKNKNTQLRKKNKALRDLLREALNDLEDHKANEYLLRKAVLSLEAEIAKLKTNQK